jgi:FO synthase subunit 2
MTLLDHCLRSVSPPIRSVLEDCLNDKELSWQEAVLLSQTHGSDLHALCWVADFLRQDQVGDPVTYVINRNINFTNVCLKSCGFCAFSRQARSEESYFLPIEEIQRRAQEAWHLGATEVCLQAGLAPHLPGSFYIELCRAIKEIAPDLHIHAFSPEEVKYGSERSGLSIREYLQALREAGLGSLPGTSAEILNDAIRDQISPGRIRTKEWIHVIQSAHDLGIPTTATVMFGHIEQPDELMQHLDLLRSLQKETQGFTEFVPLSFVHSEAPLFHLPYTKVQSGDKRSRHLRQGPTGDEVIRLIAISRLMLGKTFRNIQASWVKEGLRQAQWLLSCGANDLGGTLINESISTSAGATHGQRVTPTVLRRLIREASRIPVQRNTLYQPIQIFSSDPDQDPLDPLDTVLDPETRFGSYARLIQDPQFDYQSKKPF